VRVACLFFTQEVRIQEFAQACIRFSPQICVIEPNVILIEIGKCLKLYNEQSFVARAGVLLRRFKTEATIVISEDIPSALALARARGQSVDDLPIESLEDFADPFRTDPAGRKLILKMVESIRRLGIKTMKQFRTIPASQLPSRFGGVGLFCRQRLDGASELPWPHWSPPDSYIETSELMPSEYCANLEPLLFKAKSALDCLFSRLRGKFLRAERIKLTLELEKYSTVKKPVREWSFEFISPQGSTSGFLPILRERLSWDLQKEPIESYVTSMRFEVTAVVHGFDSQRNFFHSRDDFDEAMGSLFGQLEEFLGKDRVFWARVTEQRFPEKSWSKSKGGAEPHAEIHGKYPMRPTRIFKVPVPMGVIEGRVLLKGRRYKAIRWSQLERLALDWLDDCPARNYYRVDLESGQALWVFSDPGHHFFVHGYFE
jgi:hypothetical protein